jgi:hypothetical protein
MHGLLTEIDEARAAVSAGKVQEEHHHVGTKLWKGA